MKKNFTENVYNATCMALGEAVWQLVASGETVTQEAIARMIIELSKKRPDLADSIALSVLHSA